MDNKLFGLGRTVEYALCDTRNNARLSHLLAMAQQISMEHCNAVGIGSGYMLEQGYVFLLAKLRLDVLSMPKGGQQLVMTTRPNLPVRAQYRRCTSFADASGNLLAELDSRWVLVDAESHRLLRRQPEALNLPFLEAEPMEDFRSCPFGEPELWGEQPVVYSMLDTNGHVNNTVYGDLVCNVLGEELLSGRELRSVEIFYHREALPGDVIQLYRSVDGDRFFVRGMVNEAVCFEANGNLR